MNSYEHRHTARSLLASAKERDHSRRLQAVPFGKGTIYLVPEGIDVNEWKKKKKINLEKYRHNDVFR